MSTLKTTVALVLALALAPASIGGVKPVRTQKVSPIRNETFNKNGKARERRQGGNPRTVGKVFIFDEKS